MPVFELFSDLSTGSRTLRRGLALGAAVFLTSAVPGLTGSALAQDDTSVRRAVRAADQRPVERSTFFRPLRTFRGQPVRVGPGFRSELSIGVVRAIRADGSKSIGVVRPIRGGFGHVTPTPPVQPGGLAITRGFAPAPEQVQAPLLAPAEPGRLLVPGIAGAPEPAAGSLQIYFGQPQPVAADADPWGLLNTGRYRAAAERFDGTGDDAQRTGAALAAALSGNLNTAASLMPAAPVLPEGVVLDPATVLRLRQVRAVFYEDNAAMRDALATLLWTEK